ncbi:MAG: FAD-dependent oxidoreductase [Candidatus Taylorbacteria bacterium]|nr:FAD-dependent oxidoreductase [Candidatus Taylorbacteria bacterium]
MIEKKKIRVLLVGVGYFGKKHLQVLKSLEQQGEILLYGVVVRSEELRKTISQEYNVPVFASLTAALIKEVDVVDIVTPSTTHFALVKKCIPHAHVFVEKPLAMNDREAQVLIDTAKKYKKTLMVGHIFRFHPLLTVLKRYVSDSSHIERIEGMFINPLSRDPGIDASLEFMHLFDILDSLFGEIPGVIWTKQINRLTKVDLRYGENFDVRFELGWESNRRERILTFYFKNGNIRRIKTDFDSSKLYILNEDGTEKIETVKGSEPLTVELKCFFDVIKKKTKNYPSGEVGARIVAIAKRVKVSTVKPKVAVIGGGIFGTTAASIIAESFQVTVFERHNDILTEASYANQYRHHRGFHYPRSPETVKQIKESTLDFEKMYGEAIVEIPSYVAVAREDSKVTDHEFRQICDANKLTYKEEYPSEEFLDRSTVSMCIKTNEAIYDYEVLKKMVWKNLKKSSTITHLGAEVKKIEIIENGQKIISFQSQGKLRRETFDYVINATYANYNTVAKMLGFPERELEYRFKEIEVIQIKGYPPTAVMVMDGPFTTIVPIGNSDLYTFGDVPLSVRKKNLIFSDKSFIDWKRTVKSNVEKAMKRCQKWLPILKKAVYIKSIFVTLPIDASSRKNDDRVTSLTYHGFGCFSVLEGKIITSVSIAKKLLSQIETLEEKGK